MRTERLLVDTIVVLVLALALAGLGAAIAPWVVRTSVDAIGLTELAIASPSEPLWAYAWLAVAAALPAPLAWLVGGAYRVGARRAPPVAAVACVFVLVLGAAVGGLAYTVWVWRTMLAVPTSVVPMVTLEGLDLGGTSARFALRLAIVLAAAAFFVGRRARRGPAERVPAPPG